MNVLTKILDDILDIPNAKLAYAVSYRDYVKGMWLTIVDHYGIPATEKNLFQFKSYIESKLTGCSDIEYEWTDRQWEALMEFNPFRNSAIDCTEREM